MADLRLDVQNPRHQPAGGQREAIDALLSDGGEKLVKLAEDIAAHGLSPIDDFLVIKTPRSSSYTVLEGNRRIAAVKLLTNPDLASGHPALQRRFKNLAKSSTRIPYEARCTIAANQDEARHWIELRHTGERGGVGVVPWNTEASHRFSGRRGGHADRAVMFADALVKAYPSNRQLQGDLEKVRRNRLTTLGRLVSDPWVRDKFGIEFEAGEVFTHYPPKKLEKPIAKVVGDLAQSLTVSELKTKEQRRKYVNKLRKELPDDDTYQADPSVLTSRSRGTVKKTTTKGVKAKPQTSSTKPLFDGVELVNLGDRVTSLLREIKDIDPGRYPNASAALVRVLLELAVGQVFDIKGWTRKNSLRDEVKYCLTKLDPKGTDRKFQGVRAGLQDGTSVMAVKTIQGFLHNPNFHPTAVEVRSFASNYSPFIQGLDSLV